MKARKLEPDRRTARWNENARLRRELAASEATIQQLLHANVASLAERQRDAEALRALQLELAHANRLATLGQLAASIAHEVNQPMAAARNNAHAALRFLAQVPADLVQVREALEGVVNETYRAAHIIAGIRQQVRKAPPRMEGVDLNGAIEQVIALVRGELVKHRVAIRPLLAEALPRARADRV
jgi:C4-dicarboxylate-specific signal transduction histidine kinase